MGRRAIAAAICAGLGIGLAAPAHAAFPGQNGKIAYLSGSDISSINPDGTGQQQLTNPPPIYTWDPKWSPDGTKIAFDDGGHDVFVMNVDGSSETNITSEPNYLHEQANWSPDGTRIAYTRRFYDGNGFYGPAEIWISDPDGSNRVRLPTSAERVASPKWSPDGTRIAFAACNSSCFNGIIDIDGSNEHQLPVLAIGDWSPDGTKMVFEGTPSYPNRDIYVQNIDGTGLTDIADGPALDTRPAWSPDGSKIVFQSRRNGNPPVIYMMDADGSNQTPVTPFSGAMPDWQPIPVNAYPRPKGATPFLTYLVPAYAECTAPNREHGPSLAFGSCTPPTQTSSALTIGSADSNGKPTKSVSSVRFDTVAGSPSIPGDQADVKITAQVIDVYTQAGLNDYAGELTAKTTLRITDKLNTPHPGGPGAGTVSDIPYGFTIPCAETADITIGGSCLLSTSADALAPGAVTETKRSIWALGQVVVYDANDDPFMKQGIFVP